MPEVVHITRSDLREFELPVPGLWKRILANEVTPGLRASNRDASLPAPTWVVGCRALDGPPNARLEPLKTSTEYWFSWRLFHPGVPISTLPDEARPGVGAWASAVGIVNLT